MQSNQSRLEQESLHNRGHKKDAAWKTPHSVLVPMVGLEPTRHCWQRILSPSRLPIPTHRRQHDIL